MDKMKDAKLTELFIRARKEAPPAPEAGFANLVMTAVRHDASRRAAGELSWLDQIGVWAPQAVASCAVLIVICVVTDLALQLFGLPTLTEGVAQLSSDWLMAASLI